MLKSIFVAVSLTVLTTIAFAQTATLKTVQSSEKGSQVFKFPVIETANAAIAAEINSQIMEDIMGRLVELDLPLVHQISLQDALNMVAKAAATTAANKLTGMDYTVAYNKNNLLSLRMTFANANNRLLEKEVCFNFDLRTGNRLQLTDVIAANQMDALLEHFKQNVQLRNDAISAKLLSYPQFKNNPAAAQTLQACLKSFEKPTISDFAITKDGICFYTDYQRMITDLNAKPKDDFLYAYNFLRYFLTPEMTNTLKLS
jgi:hypothetical protein